MSIFEKIKKETPGVAKNSGFSAVCVFLGNPGVKYDGTRHNAGFMCADFIAREQKTEIKRLKFRSLTAEVMLGENRCLLLKPQTFMNNSGLAVLDAVNFHKIPPKNVIVVCDDTALAPGAIRVRAKGSAGGQKGLASIINLLGTEEIPRVRIGVGAKPHPDFDLADWVLSAFSKAELPLIAEAVQKAAVAVALIACGKLEEAQARFN